MSEVQPGMSVRVIIEGVVDHVTRREDRGTIWLDLSTRAGGIIDGLPITDPNVQVVSVGPERPTLEQVLEGHRPYANAWEGTSCNCGDDLKDYSVHLAEQLRATGVAL